MALLLTIRAGTDDATIDAQIPVPGMRTHVRALRDGAAGAIIDRAGPAAVAEDTTPVLELHDVLGVVVLFSPTDRYAICNDAIPTGPSMLVNKDDAIGPERAARCWLTAGMQIHYTLTRRLLGDGCTGAQVDAFAKHVAARLREKFPRADVTVVVDFAEDALAPLRVLGTREPVEAFVARLWGLEPGDARLS